MPSYREQLDALLGSSSQSTSSTPEASTASPAPSPDPFGIPEGVPYGASITSHGMRINLPTPVTEVKRQLAIEKQRKQMDAEVKASADASNEDAALLPHYIQVIQGALSQIPTSDNPLIATSAGHLQNWAGTAAPTFRRAVADIEAAKVPFMKSIAGMKKGSNTRITQAELEIIPKLISDLPYLPPVEQQKNFQHINALLQKAGVNDQFGTGTTAGMGPSAGTSQTGGVLKVDKLGRKAMVFPDGTFKRVP